MPKIPPNRRFDRCFSATLAVPDEAVVEVLLDSEMLLRERLLSGKDIESGTEESGRLEPCIVSLRSESIMQRVYRGI